MKLTLRISSRYKKDYRKREKTLNLKHKKKLKEAITVILSGLELANEYKDHTLTGEWNNYRECHIAPDLLMIYRVMEVVKELQLVRLGSHSELFK
jgi:mRNA interferase YafQ